MKPKLLLTMLLTALLAGGSAPAMIACAPAAFAQTTNDTQPQTQLPDGVTKETDGFHITKATSLTQDLLETLQNIDSDLGIIIDATVTIPADANLTLSCNLTIATGGRLDNFGTLTNSSKSILKVMGPLQNFRNLSNEGKLTVETNGGLFNNNNSTLTNQGTLTVNGSLRNNNGSLTNTDTGTLTVGTSGYLENNRGSAGMTNESTLEVNGRFNNNNELTNTGTLTVSGTLVNSGNKSNLINQNTLTVSGTLVNGSTNNPGTLTNASTGKLTVSGKLENNSASTLTNTGTLTVETNGGLDNTNDSTLNNEKTLTVSGSLHNYNGSRLTNTGALTVETNGGLLNDNSTLSNKDTLTVKGNLGNYNNSTLSNEDTLTVKGILSNYVQSTLTNQGALTVSGLLENYSDSTLTNQGKLKVETNGQLVHDAKNSTLENKDNGALTVGGKLVLLEGTDPTPDLLSSVTLEGSGTILSTGNPNDPTKTKYMVRLDGEFYGMFAAGETVTLTAPSKDGYRFTGWECPQKDLLSDLSDTTKTTITFTMPNTGVSFQATWTADTPTEPDTPDNPDTPDPPAPSTTHRKRRRPTTQTVTPPSQPSTPTVPEVPGTPVPEGPGGTPALDTVRAEVAVGGSYQFLVKGEHDPAKLKVEVLDPQIASVVLSDANDPRGVKYTVQAKASGSTQIRVTANGQSSVMSLELKAPRGSLTLDTVQYQLAPGQQYTIGALLRDASGNALLPGQIQTMLRNGELSVRDSRTGSIVDLQVRQNGNASITAKHAGTCYIIYRVQGKEMSVRIDVAPGVQPAGVAARATSHWM